MFEGGGCLEYIQPTPIAGHVYPLEDGVDIIRDGKPVLALLVTFNIRQLILPAQPSSKQLGLYKQLGSRQRQPGPYGAKPSVPIQESEARDCHFPKGYM